MKKQYYYLIISILLFVLFSGMAVKKQLVNTIGYNMCSKEEIEIMEEQMVFAEKTNIGEFLFQGTPIPFCENTETYYLPLNTQANWRWEYKFFSSNPSVKIYWCEDSYWNDMEKAIECSHEFSF